VITVKANLEEITRKLGTLTKGDLRFAAAKSLTQTAQAVRTATLLEMQRRFDRPTPYTMRALAVDPAKKDALVSAVFLRTDNPSKGTPWVKALGAEFVGGQRHWRRFEGAMLRTGIMPPGLAAVPGKGAKLDAYGNIPVSLITQLISYFGAFGEQGYRANMTTKRKGKLAQRGTTEQGFATINGVVYYVSKGKGTWFGGGSWKHGRYQHLPAGIWAKTGIHGSRLLPIILFVRKPTYHRLIDLQAIGDHVAPREFAVNLKKNLAAITK
jgi:hypothetical protein